MSTDTTAPSVSYEGIDLGAIDPSCLPFPADSMLRRVVSEPVIGVVLQRTLLMDIAHPKVGSGVQDHSGFTTEPLRRALGTLDAAVALVFGDEHLALAAAQHVYRVHDHINGPLAVPMTNVVTPTSYTAHDESLLRWVWATLVDTAEMAFERWVRPFRPGEADALYRDFVVWAQFFGMRPDRLPPDRAAFHEYLEGMLDDPQLGSAAVSQAVARNVLWPPARSVPDLAVRPLRALSIATLDPRLRTRLGLELSPRDQRLADRLDRALRVTYHRLPRARTYGPAVYLAVRGPVVGVLRRARKGGS